MDASFQKACLSLRMLNSLRNNNGEDREGDNAEEEEEEFHGNNHFRHTLHLTVTIEWQILIPILVNCLNREQTAL